jgi:hypothetical protein
MVQEAPEIQIVKTDASIVTERMMYLVTRVFGFRYQKRLDLLNALIVTNDLNWENNSFYYDF